MHSPAWTWGPWCYGNDYECNDIPPPADMAGVRKVCEALGIKLTESSQDV